ncbi:hypothetical protein HGRIS_003409 [Hohenbuehelia grisea]|uniref:Protein FRA10AC1 n=1 Tax=Hohenbuehelia grisea TaxID=104357 RepID=A0ABR3JFA2_9AGAR
MALYSSSSRSEPSRPTGSTEFDILKSQHKFLREDEDERKLSWDEALAAKYYSNLYREFAVCDLKHYKSGQFALRWRTENEVLSGAGETSCGNTRCEHHASTAQLPKLTTLELPFAYQEHGEAKSALVKVVLCPRCLKKLMWKRDKERVGARVGLEVAIAEGNGRRNVEEDAGSSRGMIEAREEGLGRDSRVHRDSRDKPADGVRLEARDDVGGGRYRRHSNLEADGAEVDIRRRRRTSRSQSPHDKRSSTSFASRPK